MDYAVLWSARSVSQLIFVLFNMRYLDEEVPIIEKVEDELIEMAVGKMEFEEELPSVSGFVPIE